MTKGRAGIRCDSVVEKVWKGIGGNQEEILLSKEKVWGYKTEVKVLRNKVKEEEHVSAPPNGLHENAETAMSCREPGPARKKKEVRVPVVGRRRKMNRCALATKQ